MKKLTSTIKQIIFPPYKKSDVPVLVVSVLVLVGLVLSVSLVNRNTNYQGKAASINLIEPESGTISGSVTIASDANASGGQYVLFGGTISSTPPTGICSGAANTPGGSDPWGGCWPGAFNTGYPHGLTGDTRAPVTLSAYTGPCDLRSDNEVIDSKTFNCGGMLVYAKNVTIKNSKINGPINTNAAGASITLQDTEVDGGSDHSQAVGLDNVTVIRGNIHGDQHAVHCNSNCVVENSWLHDQYAGGAALGWHQNGFLSNGGSNFTLTHNSVGCIGGCTADIAFIPDGNVSNATVTKNLLLATTDAAYCLYPSSNHPSKPGIINQMTITNNVFQRGANSKCAVYGPVYGWDQPNNTPGTDGYGNVWAGNIWADTGAAINP